MTATELRRFLPKSAAKIELRAEGDRPTSIAGYGSVFYDPTNPDSEYRIDYDLYERFGATAFAEYLASNEDCIGCWDHNSSNLLGRRAAGTLKLTADSRGLLYEIPFDPTDPDHQRIGAKLRRGDVTGSSQRFIATEERWMREDRAEGRVIIREITRAILMDIGPQTFPAYPGTSAELRTSDGWKIIMDKKAEFLAAESVGAAVLLIEMDSLFLL
jgi:uncharacterized protein